MNRPGFFDAESGQSGVTALRHGSAPGPNGEPPVVVHGWDTQEGAA